MQLSYRILNYIMKFWFLLFGFYLSLGIPQFLFKVFCCSYYFVYSFLFGIRLCRLLLLSIFFFVFRSGTTDFAKAGQVSDDTINLINYQLTLLISYKLLSSY